MRKVLQLVGATLLGVVAGSLVNMSLVRLGSVLVAPPAGADLGSMAGLQVAMPLFGPWHFLFPFLAHALGTLVGAGLACLVAPNRAALPGWIIAGFFLLGGIAAVVMLPAPLWFEALDLLLAYLPMAWAGIALARRRTQPAPVAA
jgi:hypothetical protein